MSNLSKGYSWCFKLSSKIGGEEETVGGTKWDLGGVFSEEMKGYI
jgi:hypothetical protein